MANIGLVADYGSSSDNDPDLEHGLTKNENQEKITLISEASGASQTSSVNYFESVPDEEDVIEGVEAHVRKGPKKKMHKKVLVNPLRNDSFIKSYVEPSSSVFYNPFKKEQEAKKSVLEKHVKLTNNPKDVLEINGKKICWNYRKGRCKFGHNCKYAHDSDLIGGVSVPDSHNSTMNDSYGTFNDIVIPDEPEVFKKRKPGLADGLIPNKRSRNVYKNIQSKEAPWLNKR